MTATKLAKTRLSTKGQVILPKAVRDAQQWGAGQELVVEQVAGGVVLRAAKPFAATRFEDVFGSLTRYAKPMTEEQVAAALKSAAKKRYARD
jgi:AbrB family looped-hinge helix DNA binding protein